MATLNPAMIDALLDVQRRADAAGHGGRGAVYAEACARLGISRATLAKRLREITVRPPRKRRADAGDTALGRDEAMLISAVLMDSLRKNAKRLQSIGAAVEILRANGEIRAERIDTTTGECLPLSDAAIGRALRGYGLHPDQLLRPAPHTELRSLHPNHIWEIDASMCVLYYLKSSGRRETGLQVMAADKFYKNKPRNLKRIENDRVWSYEVTDHFSGAIFVHYVLGAESISNLAESFILATQQRGTDPYYGVPFGLALDPGSAATSGAFGNLSRRLDVELYVHAARNARATGQVECARNIIERSFEAGLRLKPVADLDTLNREARSWARWYNGTKIHSRHGLTRFAAWMQIRSDQLRTVDADLARTLLTHTPESRRVTGTLTVEFGGREFDVSSIPRVMVGEKLSVTWSPYQPDCAVIVDTDADGHEQLHTVPAVERGAGGFRIDAPVIGERYARPADTVADQHRRAVERLATDTTTDEAAAAARKRGGPSFGGRLDPSRVIEQTELPTYLPRRGTELLPAAGSTPAERVLNAYEVAAELVRRGVTLTADTHERIRQWYPDGVPEPEIDQLQQRLTVRAGLRVVGG